MKHLKLYVKKKETRVSTTQVLKIIFYSSFFPPYFDPEWRKVLKSQFKDDTTSK